MLSAHPPNVIPGMHFTLKKLEPKP